MEKGITFRTQYTALRNSGFLRFGDEVLNCFLLEMRLKDETLLLRDATPADIGRLRQWDSKPHVIAASGDDDWFDWEAELPRRVSWREMLIAELGGRPIGVVQIIDPALEETHYWGQVDANLRAIDIWIGEEEDLGRGYGTRMMQMALARCFQDPLVTSVLIDPLAGNTDARRFYERLGFKPLGLRKFGEDLCMVYRFDREDLSSIAP